jgi:hypothetical protein
MDDTQTIWNFREPAATRTPQTEEATSAAIQRHVVAVAAASESGAAIAQTSTPLQEPTAVSLHPEQQQQINERLHNDAEAARNLCMVVGTLTREYWGDARDQPAAEKDERDARRVRTPLGTMATKLHMDVQEVLTDGVATSFMSYRLPLNVPPRLAEAAVFADNERVTVSGSLRMERSYDERFAADDLDPGQATWTLRLYAISIQPLSEASPMPDGSWVQIEGEIDDEPIVRLRPIGPQATIPFASVSLRCRIPMRNGFTRSHSQYHSSVIIPLEVPLDGSLAHAGALLKRGNRVQVDGRLTAYEFRRRADAPEGAPERRRELAARVHDALTRAEARVRHNGGNDGRVRAAKQRLLSDSQLAVSVGYVELQHGTELDEEQIVELIATRPRRVRAPQTDARTAAPEPEPEQITAELDLATNAKLGEADALAEHVEEHVDEQAPSEASTRRPRRRPRESLDELTAPDEA